MTLDLHRFLVLFLDYLIRFFPTKGIELEGGGRLFRISRDDWEYLNHGIRIRFITEILSGEYYYVLYSKSMYYNMGNEDKFDSVEISNAVIRPENKVESLEIRNEVVHAFVAHMNSIGKKVKIQ